MEEDMVSLVSALASARAACSDAMADAMASMADAVDAAETTAAYEAIMAANRGENAG